MTARRSVQRRGSLVQRFMRASGPGDAAPSPELAALGRERRHVVVEALEMLKDRERIVIHLRYFLELSEQEMAEVLHCRRGTVKSRHSRAMGRLRGIVEEQFPELGPEGLR